MTKAVVIPEKSALRRTLQILRPHLSGQGLLMAGGVLVLLCEVAFRVLEPWPVKFVVDAVTRSLGADFAGTGPEATPLLLLACGAALVFFTGMRAVCNFFATLAFALVGSRVATKLRAKVFDHVQSLSARFHSVNRTGDTVQRLVGDVGRLQEVAVTAGMPLLANCITLVAMAGVMFWLDPLLASPHARDFCSFHESARTRSLWLHGLPARVKVPSRTPPRRAWAPSGLYRRTAWNGRCPTGSAAATRKLSRTA